MKVSCSIAYSMIRDVPEGHLVAFDDPEGLSYAIVLKKHEGGVLLAFIRPKGQPSVPHHASVDFDRECLDFGNESVVEPVFQADKGGFSVYDDTPGVFALVGNQKLLRLARNPADIRSTAMWLDLETLKPTGGIASAAIFKSWRVWQDEGDRLLAGRDPLFTYKV